MGIFDNLFKGPELTKDEAVTVSVSMAFNLYRDYRDYRDGFALEQFIKNADILLEGMFKIGFPHHSISNEQSKQILKNVVKIFTEEKEHLENMTKLSIYMDHPIPENQPTKKVVTPDHLRGRFNLFED